MRELFVHKCVLPRQLDAQSADAALGWYRSMTLVSMSNLNAQRILKSSEVIMSERARQLREGGFTIHPFSDFRTVWDFIISVSIFFIMILESLILTFEYTGNAEMEEVSKSSDVIYVINGILFLDIIINCFTGYYNPEKKMTILNRRMIMLNYVKTKKLFVHVIFAIPWYLLSVTLMRYFKSLENMQTVDLRDWFSIASMVRLIRINELTDYLQVFEKYTAQNKIFWRMFDLMIKVTITLHYCTCLELSLFGLLVSELVDSMRFSNDSWVVQENFVEMYNGNFLGQYGKCLYRACSCLLLHGDGTSMNKTVEDRLLANILRLIGVFFQLYVLSHLLLIVRSEYSGQRKYQNTLHSLDELVRHKKLPLEKKKRILMYFEYKYENTFFNEKKLLSMLSVQLQKEIKECLSRKVVESFHYFSKLPRNIVDEIIKCLTNDVYLPGDVIIKAGAAGNSMYFLVAGSVAVYAKNGDEVRHLDDGCYFGEISLLAENNVRSASVVAIETCELQALSRWDFRRIMSPYPDLLESVKKISLHEFPMLDQFRKSHQATTLLSE